MRRTNKAGDWQELLVLTECDLGIGSPGAGPAIRVTFARYGREVRFSHTPGVIDDDGQFRPVQHLHDRSVRGYTLLLQYTSIAVEATRKLDPEAVVAQSYWIKKMLKDAVEASMDETASEGPQAFPEPEQQQKAQKAQSLTKPTLGVSIGEILKAKQKG
jgi:hypothetical protein